MPSVFDIFNDNAFSLISLTDRINKMPFVPTKLGDLGIFASDGVPTTNVAIEEYNGALSLVPTVPRGAPPNQNAHNKRKLRNLAVPHIPISDTIVADEVQNVRVFGNDQGQLAGVQAVVDMRMMEMSSKLDATVEYGRVGALKGVILDADGSTVIYNLFTEFGVSQQTTDFVLGTTTTNLVGKITAAKRLIEDELGALNYTNLYALCGINFWDRFVSHTAITNAYQFFEATGQNMNPLREDLRYSNFVFGGVIWDQYRGKVGGVSFIPDDEAYLFPIGVPNLFKTYFAPADYIETVNTIGLPRYAKQYMSDFSNRSVTVETQTNPLSICTRPRTIIKLTTSN